MLDQFCRDFRSYLEEELKSSGAYVAIRIGRLVERCGWTPQCIGAYATFLRRLLGDEHKVAKGVYKLPYEVAKSIYNNLDKLCEELKTRRKSETRRGMALVSFHVSTDMLNLLDETAMAMGISRAELVREAIRKMLERMRGHICVTLTPEEQVQLMRLVSHGVYASIEETVRDAIRQLLQKLNSTTT
jgi:Arc/MetJ-type ribon-helix-helix transcriptional regulator